MMGMNKFYVVVAVVALTAAVANASVVLGTTDTFDASLPSGTLWGLDGATPADGWHHLAVNWDPNNPGQHVEYFGNTTKQRAGQDPAVQTQLQTHSGAPGTLLVQYLASWGNQRMDGTQNPGTPWHDPQCTQINYIEFQGVAGVTYSVDAWAAAIYNDASGGSLANHPQVVNKATDNPPQPVGAQFPNIQIGLKQGSVDATDVTTNYPAFTLSYPANDMQWVHSPVVTLTATVNGPISIILKTSNPDTRSGIGIDTDTRFDDVHIMTGPTCSVPWADANGDGFVDMVDFAILQTCLSQGAAGTFDMTHCGCFDHNKDNTVDGNDVAAFVQCAAGPSIPVDPANCP
jgi:hypothetical protein